MKPFRSLRLRITLLCALLLTLCCAALAVTSNLSAIHLTDTIAAAPLSPALDPEAAAKGTMPLLTTQAAPVVQQAQQLFQIQSILILGAVRAPGKEFPNREWGYGQLNLFNTFNEIRML